MSGYFFLFGLQNVNWWAVWCLHISAQPSTGHCCRSECWHLTNLAKYPETLCTLSNSFCNVFYFSIEFRGGGGTQCSHGIIGAGKESENVELNCSRQFNINILNGYTIYDNRNLFSIIKQKPDCLEICFNSQQCIRRGGVSNFVSFAMCCTLVS